MDWKPFLVAFATIFVAELGDKRQLAACFIAAEQQCPWMVLLGASIALTVVSAIGVLVGHFAGACLPRDPIRYVAAGLFVIIGVLIALNVI
ncbi:MAG: TMEM165/GDT1 family protein [Armatimonadota bacterium]|nr:TMEM165/GDT1 family protein [Armatimonadota bacterium]